MKLTHSLILVTAASLFAAAPTQAATDLLLDFTQTSGGAYVAGWTPVYGNFLSDTPVTSVSNIQGLGYDFSVTHVACFDNGNTDETLIRSGFYTFGNDDNAHTFSLSGLAEGVSVSLYACAAWDGSGRGAVIAFGDSGVSGVKAQTLGDPGNTPSLANLTLIGTAIADGSGIVTGTLTGAGGFNTATEGQVGAMVFEISTVPEPSALALAALGFVLAARPRKSRHSN